MTRGTVWRFGRGFIGTECPRLEHLTHAFHRCFSAASGAWHRGSNRDRGLFAQQVRYRTPTNALESKAPGFLQALAVQDPMGNSLVLHFVLFHVVLHSTLCHF